MADEEFKLPGSSYEELARIVRVYGEQQGEASPAQVPQVLGIDADGRSSIHNTQLALRSEARALIEIWDGL